MYIQTSFSHQKYKADFCFTTSNEPFFKKERLVAITNTILREPVLVLDYICMSIYYANRPLIVTKLQALMGRRKAFSIRICLLICNGTFNLFNLLCLFVFELFIFF